MCSNSCVCYAVVALKGQINGRKKSSENWQKDVSDIAMTALCKFDKTINLCR